MGAEGSFSIVKIVGVILIIAGIILVSRLKRRRR